MKKSDEISKNFFRLPIDVKNCFIFCWKSNTFKARSWRILDVSLGIQGGAQCLKGWGEKARDAAGLTAGRKGEFG